MNLRLPLLGLSCVGHLAAAYHFFVARPSTTAPASAAPIATAPVQSVGPDAAAPETTAATATDPTTLWQRLDQPALPDLVNALRRAGFPSDMVTVVARYRLELELNAFKANLNYPNDTVGYWQKPAKSTREQQLALSDFMAQCDRRLREALGTDLATSAPRLAELKQRWGDFDTAKLQTLDAIEQDYRELFSASMRDNPDGAGPAAIFTLLEKERNADIAATLGPDDYFTYRVRNSTLASTLRQTFAYAHLTEDEFLAVFRAAEAAPPATSVRGVLPPGASATIIGRTIESPNLPATLEQLSTTLPAERIAELKQLVAPDAFAENRIVLRLGLPITTAATLTDYQRELQTLARTAAQPSATPEQRAAALNQITTIHQSLQTLLGPDGYTILTSVNGGRRYPTPDQVTTPASRRPGD